MEQHPTTWRVGNVKISKVVEMELEGAPSDMILKGLTPAEVQALPWLQPYFATPEGGMNLTIQAFVIESEGKKIIVDTCVGNDKKRDFPPWNEMQTPFLTDLAKAGFTRDSITTVLCTHLHVDHVGWNTMLVDGKWVPTFPKANYLFAKIEWAHWQAEIAALKANPPPPPAEGELPIDPSQVMNDSVIPVIDAGLHTLVETDHVITSEVSLIPTPGHTPGHVSVRIRSNGEEAIITGDMMHHPYQIAVPDQCSNFDTDEARGQATRHAFVKTNADTGVRIFGTHFSAPTVGCIVSDGKSYKLKV